MVLRHSDRSLLCVSVCNTVHFFVLRGGWVLVQYIYVLGTVEARENQYRRILYHPWVEKSLFDGKILDDPVVFWSKIKTYSNDVSRPYQ